MSLGCTPEELAAWTGGYWDPGPPAAIRSVCHDSRTLEKDDLFVALKGIRFDGHEFVTQAFRKGASAAVVVREYRRQAGDGNLLRVHEPVHALRMMAAGYRRKVAPLVVAVTGSAGKTTVKEMIATVLATTFRTAKTQGNWNNELGLPLSILNMQADTRVGVFELGINHPGEMQPLCEVLRPDWGVITNIGPVHIEFFGSVEAIAREKADVLRCLPAAGMAVLNRDSMCFELLRAAASDGVITVSAAGQAADYACLSYDAATRRAKVKEAASGGEFVLRLALPGRHNVANALLAIAVGRGLGVEWERILAALENYRSLPMRWEQVEIGGVKVINDAYNANPLSVRAALETFAQEPAMGRKWLLLADMLELGTQARSEHFALGAAVGAGPWAGLITVGPLARAIAEGAMASGMPREQVVWCENNREAAMALAARVAAGDTVLMKGSRGMRLEEVVGVLKSQMGGTQL